MSLTLTFFALDLDGAEQVLRRTVIPDEALMTYQSAPESALLAAERGSGIKADGFRITDGRARVRVTFTQGRR